MLISINVYSIYINNFQFIYINNFQFIQFDAVVSISLIHCYSLLLINLVVVVSSILCQLAHKLSILAKFTFSIYYKKGDVEPLVYRISYHPALRKKTNYTS